MTLVYALGKAICRFIHVCTVRETVIHRERLDRVAGGCVVACTHLGHLDPCFVSLVSRRAVDWMTRIEFYRYHVAADLLGTIGAFPVNRFGIPVSTMRTAIDRVRRGRIVGTFPEGGVARGVESAMKGGRIKGGAALIALRGGVPIIPIVTLGTDRLQAVGPWLPFKRIRLWMIVGEPIAPPPTPERVGRRAARRAMTEELSARFQSLYQELCGACGLDRVTAAGTSVPA